MKKCENCFEENTDGATHCVICGEAMAMGVMTEIEAILDRTPETPIDPPLEIPVCIDVPAPIPDSIPVSEPVPVEVAPVVVETVLPPPETVLPPTEAVLPDPEALLPALESVPIKAALEVYHDTEPRMVFSYDILNDITLVGREDPQRDVFPDLDLAKLEKDGVSARSASREHLRLLRQGNQFFLFIFRGSTGTQVNKELIPESKYGKRFEIQIGDRIVLGGKVRLKLVEKK